MRLGLTSVMDTPGAVLPFTCTLDLSHMEMGYQRPATQPVQVNGQVENRAGVVWFEATVEAELSLSCDRCAAGFTKRKTLPVSCVLAFSKQHEDSDDIFQLESDTLDIADIVVPAFVLDMSLQTLCREDCKGLCPVCGHNLNQGDCGCPRREADPRWAKLQDFLSPNTEGEDNHGST